MMRLLPKSYYKRLLLITLIVFNTWFVYAHFGNPFHFEVKVIKCYPNPATSVINFEFTGTLDKSSTLQIYSFSGKKMIDQSFATNKITVLLDNNFYRGIYIFQLHDKNGKILETGKFQVVK